MINNDDFNIKVYEELFIKYFEALCAFSYSYIPDIELAKDIVQEAFASLWEKRGVYMPTKALLYKIVRNKLLDYVKSNHHLKSIDIISADILTDASDLDQSEEVDFRNLSEEIHTGIENLPAQCKKIFILSRIENLKNREIASQLGITVKAVEKQITKALSLVRKHLEKNGMLLMIISFIFLFLKFQDS